MSAPHFELLDHCRQAAVALSAFQSGVHLSSQLSPAGAEVGVATGAIVVVVVVSVQAQQSVCVFQTVDGWYSHQDEHLHEQVAPLQPQQAVCVDQTLWG